MPRRTIDQAKLLDLAGSLERRGQLVPISVRWVEGRGKFVIITGERRWRAAQLTRRIRTLQCLVVDDSGAVETLLYRLAEDLARDDFPLIEVGEMLVKLQALKGWSVRRMAAELGVPIHRVHRPMTLMRLTPPVIEMVRRGELLPSHAFEIEKAPAEKQQALAEMVLREGLSFEETVDMVGVYRTEAGDSPQCKRRRWKFPFPNDCEVSVITSRKGGRTEIRRMLLEILVLLEQD